MNNPFLNLTEKKKINPFMGLRVEPKETPTRKPFLPTLKEEARQVFMWGYTPEEMGAEFRKRVQALEKPPTLRERLKRPPVVGITKWLWRPKEKIAEYRDKPLASAASDMMDILIGMGIWRVGVGTVKQSAVNKFLKVGEGKLIEQGTDPVTARVQMKNIDYLLNRGGFVKGTKLSAIKAATKAAQEIRVPPKLVVPKVPTEIPRARALVPTKVPRPIIPIKPVVPKVPEITPEQLKAGFVPVRPPISPTPPVVQPPEFAGEPTGDPIVRLNELLKASKPIRAKIETKYTQERARRIAEVERFINTQVDQVGGEEGYRKILARLKGELISPEARVRFEPIKDKLTEAESKNLYARTWKHPYLDSWEKVSAAEGLTRILSGEIPQPKQLTLLEEVYGTELVKGILSKRLMGAKVGDFLTELANVPRAIMATADMSAFLRQGVVPVVAHPVISAKAIGKTFKFAFSQKVFNQWFQDLPKDPLYSLIRKSKLSITDPSKAGLVEREEAFISRFLQKIPVVGPVVRFAERSYVGFLNKMRVDLFKTWSDELLSKGLSPVKDLDVFKAVADIANTFTGRGSMGALNRITPQLNVLFFSPRLITARFNALNPTWYMRQPPEIRKKAIGDFAKFVVAGTTLLALIKAWKDANKIPDSQLSVEPDPRSSDFGKIKIENTRWDIWGGFQQWARVFVQLVSGERKNTRTGEIVSLSKDEYPFTTRKETLLRFIEGKLAPIPALVNELLSGAKTFQGEDITLETVTKQRLVPMYIQDIAEAYADGGLGRAVGAGVSAFFGVGVQTWQPRLPTRRKLRRLKDIKRNPFMRLR